MSKRAKSGCQTEHYYVGAVVDERYRLTDFIGAGGMACVYRAQEEGSPHQYAMKFLKAEYHGQDYLIEYFRDEAGSMRDLAHPNIVRFYRFVNRPDYSYILMDYVDGFALLDVMRKIHKQARYIPLDEVVRVMTQVARALDAIHREGYVHRDIKPGNVLIERSTGQTFLTDLGITTVSNTKMEGAGTLAYMPPELAETWTADHRADVYSFAIMYYELLTNKRPFRVTKGLRGQEAEDDLLEKHKYAPVPNIKEFRNDLPDKLNPILEKALAKSPSDRYSSIIEFARDVHTILKPKLSADLQDFTAITHHHIEAPDTAANGEQASSNNLNMGLIAGGVIFLIIAGLILANLLFPNLFNTTPAATNTPEPTDTLVPTPNPLTGLPIFNNFLTGVSALSEPVNAEELIVPMAEDGGLQYLQIGRDVNGFSVRINIASHENISRFGIAFRVQDANNYLLFAVESESGAWAFQEVINGTATTLDSGTLSAVPQQIAISGYDNFYQVETDSESFGFDSETFQTGSLALFVRGDGTLNLNSLVVSLVGDDAVSAAAATPTAFAGLADPRRFLRSDVTAMLQSNDIANSAIRCPEYIEAYESLERHLDSSNAEVRNLAQEIIDIGELVYARCRSESPDGSLSFGSAIQDYLQWENSLRAIQQDLSG